MPTSPIFRSLLLVALAGVLSGCASSTGQAVARGSAAAHAATSADSFAQTRWELTRWTAADGTPRPLPHGNGARPIELTFLAHDDQYRVQGYAGCNRYAGTYRLQDGKLTISAPAATRMACPTPGLAQLERDYLNALARIQTFTLDSGGAPRHLSFNVRDGDVLEFTRRQDPPTPR